MEPTADDLAGVVDLFGGLTRPELRRAFEELAFKRGTDVDGDSLDGIIDDALASYHLLSVPAAERNGDAPLLVAGPTAFPTLPDDAEDLPHIMDVDRRDVDEATLARVATERFERDAAAAVDDGDDGRIAALLDVSYDLEAWASVDVSEVRERLADAGE